MKAGSKAVRTLEHSEARLVSSLSVQQELMARERRIQTLVQRTGLWHLLAITVVVSRGPQQFRLKVNSVVKLEWVHLLQRQWSRVLRQFYDL
jgi:hypothetical protein